MRNPLASTAPLAIALVALSSCQQPVGTLNVEVRSAREIVISIPDRYRIPATCNFTLFIEGNRYVGADGLYTQVNWQMGTPDGLMLPCPRRISFPEGLPGYDFQGVVEELPPGTYWVSIYSAYKRVLRKNFVVP